MRCAEYQIPGTPKPGQCHFTYRSTRCVSCVKGGELHQPLVLCCTNSVLFCIQPAGRKVQLAAPPAELSEQPELHLLVPGNPQPAGDTILVNHSTRQHELAGSDRVRPFQGSRRGCHECCQSQVMNFHFTDSIGLHRNSEIYCYFISQFHWTLLLCSLGAWKAYGREQCNEDYLEIYNIHTDQSTQLLGRLDRLPCSVFSREGVRGRGAADWGSELSSSASSPGAGGTALTLISLSQLLCVPGVLQVLRHHLPRPGRLPARHRGAQAPPPHRQPERVVRLPRQVSWNVWGFGFIVLTDLPTFTITLHWVAVKLLILLF